MSSDFGSEWEYHNKNLVCYCIKLFSTFFPVRQLSSLKDNKIISCSIFQFATSVRDINYLMYIKHIFLRLLQALKLSFLEIISSFFLSLIYFCKNASIRMTNILFNWKITIWFHSYTGMLNILNNNGLQYCIWVYL